MKVFNDIAFWAKKHLPEILVTTGFVATVSAGVIACTQTPKAVAAVKEAKESIKLYEQCAKEGKCLTASGEVVEYSEADAANDTALVKRAATFTVVKAYAAPVLLAAAGGVAIFGGFHKQKKATLAAVATAASYASSFAAYRANAKARFGEQVDGELLSGKWDTTQYVEKDAVVEKDENGNEVKKDRVIVSTGDGSNSAYVNEVTLLWDEHFQKWSEVPSVSRMKLENAQRYWTDKLNTRGYVFVNEVIEYLGAKAEKELCEKHLGWKSKRKGGNTDRIYFGIDDNTPEMNAFNRGQSNVTKLVLNIDGNILDCLA